MTEANFGIPTVVCICGTLAAGKTTLLRNLVQRLEASAVLVFDEYEAHCEWPKDFSQWMAQGCDPGGVRNPRLQQDLKSLRSGSAIHHPLDEHIIEPSPIILLGDPFGRTRPDNRDLIDLVLFLDLPWDLSVVRMTQRALGLDHLPPKDQLGVNAADDLFARIDSARQWLSAYAARRTMYTSVSEAVRTTADVILDGTKSAEAVLEDALATINQRVSEFTDKGVS